MGTKMGGGKKIFFWCVALQEKTSSNFYKRSVIVSRQWINAVALNFSQPLTPIHYVPNPSKGNTTTCTATQTRERNAQIFISIAKEDKIYWHHVKWTLIKAFRFSFPFFFLLSAVNLTLAPFEQFTPRSKRESESENASQCNAKYSYQGMTIVFFIHFWFFFLSKTPTKSTWLSREEYSALIYILS